MKGGVTMTRESARKWNYVSGWNYRCYFSIPILYTFLIERRNSSNNLTEVFRTRNRSYCVNSYEGIVMHDSNGRQLKGQCHEITFTRLFSSTVSFWSYKRYAMRNINFAEFSRWYSTIKKPRRCSLHRWARSPVWPTQTSPQKCCFLTETRRCRLHQGVWTHRSRLHRRVQTSRCSLHQWLISPISRPTYALKGTIHKKSDCKC
jgi:hypothetical protein